MALAGLATLLLTVSGLQREAGAQAADPTISTYVLSTATTGGAFHQGGVSLSALVKIKLLPEQRIDLVTRNSSGSMENIARLRDHSSDFGIVQGLLGYQARSGTGLAAKMGPQRELRAVTMLWPNVEHFILRADEASSATMTDFLALERPRVSLGREPSAIESNNVLLGNLGLDIDRDLDLVYLDFRSSAAAFARGEIDGLSLPASTPVPAFIDLIGRLGGDARVLNWSADQLALADGGLGLWSPITIPAHTYPGQSDPIETIGQPNFLAVHADVDEDTVYAITKLIFENLPFLQRLHQPFKFLSLEHALDGLPVPLHRGAARYFRELRLDLAKAVAPVEDYGIFGSDRLRPAEIKERIGRGVVKLIMPEDGTSDRMIDDLVDVLASDDQIRVLPLKGRGTGHNLADLLYLSGVDIGVLQADSLDHARRQNLYPDLVGNIRYITKWHDAELHLLTSDDILGVDDLLGKRVNFGPRGSGSEVTASILFNQLNIPVERTSFGHRMALEKLKAGEIAGMVYVAGKPIPLLDSIEVRDGLRLLSVPMIDDDGLYRRTEITEADYPSLVFGNQRIETLAVALVLASYDWPSDSDRYRPIATFVDKFLNELDTLRDDRRHPKWREIDPAAELEPWQRHQATEAFLRRQADAREDIGVGGPLTPPHDEAASRPAPGPDAARQGETPPGRPATAVSPTSSHRRPVF